MSDTRDPAETGAGIQGAALLTGLAAFSLARGPLAASLTNARRATMRAAARGEPTAAADALVADRESRLGLADMAALRAGKLRPEPKKDAALIFGRVLRGLVGIENLSVTAFDERDRKLAAARSDANGSWELTVAGSAQVCLVVSKKRDILAVRRPRLAVGPGERHYVEIALDAPPQRAPSRTPPKPAPEPTAPEPRQVKVPKIVEMREEKALTRLGAAGLMAGSRTEGAFGGRLGTVVRQTPQAGEVVAAGTAVSYAVSVEPGVPAEARRPMPDLVGMTASEAAAVLRAANLVTGRITLARGRVEAPTVAGQEPSPGAAVVPDVQVELTVKVARPVTAPIDEVLAVAALQPAMPSGIDVRRVARALARSGAGDVTGARALLKKKEAEFAQAAGIQDPRGAAALKEALAATLSLFGGD